MLFIYDMCVKYTDLHMLLTNEILIECHTFESDSLIGLHAVAILMVFFSFLRNEREG